VHLAPTQRAVTQKSASEPAFANEFWDHKAAGVYVDVVSGEPLSTSTKTYDRGCAGQASRCRWSQATWLSVKIGATGW
jgi:peptide methionine sulfoxide reductase MsrB